MHQSSFWPSGTRLNIEALKNNEILSQIVTEINEKDGECKKKKEDPALSKEYRRFIYEQALNDADESENEEELLTMEGISPNSFFLPQASTNIAEQISHITCNYCPLFGRPFSGTKVFGFTVRLFVVYSDGIDVSVGETRDTIKARLDLEKGEHIVGVTPIFDEVDRIGFRLSTGLYLFAETISYGPFRTVG